MTLEQILTELNHKRAVNLSEDDSEKLNLYVEHLEILVKDSIKERKTLYEYNRTLREKLQS